MSDLSSDEEAQSSQVEVKGPELADLPKDKEFETEKPTLMKKCNAVRLLYSPKLKDHNLRMCLIKGCGKTICVNFNKDSLLNVSSYQQQIFIFSEFHN